MDHPDIQFLHEYSNKDNVDALKGGYINRLKVVGRSAVPKEHLIVTLAGKKLSTKETIAKIRIPHSEGDKNRSYTASNEPFIISKQ